MHFYNPKSSPSDGQQPTVSRSSHASQEGLLKPKIGRRELMADDRKFGTSKLRLLLLVRGGEGDFIGGGDAYPGLRSRCSLTPGYHLSPCQGFGWLGTMRDARAVLTHLEAKSGSRD